MRNEFGDWIKRFTRNCGKLNIVLAELWALRNGLKLAADEKISNLIVELDDLAIVHLMRNSNSNLSLEPLLIDCRLLLKKFLNLQVVHVYREANWCADTLERIGSSNDKPFILFALPPLVVD